MNLKAEQLEGKDVSPEGFNHFIYDLLRVSLRYLRFKCSVLAEISVLVEDEAAHHLQFYHCGHVAYRVINPRR